MKTQTVNFDNDGIIWHPHWVILTEDKRVEGGLAVKQFDPKDTSVVLPPTNPGMPMYMDSVQAFRSSQKEIQLKWLFPIIG
jgi:hypothetical protein